MAAVFLSEVSGVFDSFFLRVAGHTLSSLNSFSKLCMSSILTEVLRCSYKVRTETYNCDLAAFQPGRISFVSEQPHNSQPQSNMSHHRHPMFTLRVCYVNLLSHNNNNNNNNNSLY